MDDCGTMNRHLCSFYMCPYPALFVCQVEACASANGPFCQMHQEHHKLEYGGHPYQPLEIFMNATLSTAKQICDLWSQLHKKISDLSAAQHQPSPDFASLVGIELRPMIDTLNAAQVKVERDKSDRLNLTHDMLIKKAEERKTFCLQLSQAINFMSSVYSANYEEVEKLAIYDQVIKPRLNQLQQSFPVFWSEAFAGTTQTLTLTIDEQRLETIKVAIANAGDCPMRANVNKDATDRHCCSTMAIQSHVDDLHQAQPSTSGIKTLGMQCEQSDSPCAASLAQSNAAQGINRQHLDLPLPAQRPPAPPIAISSERADGEDTKTSRRFAFGHHAGVSKLESYRSELSPTPSTSLVNATTATEWSYRGKCETFGDSVSRSTTTTVPIETITIDGGSDLLLIKCESRPITPTFGGQEPVQSEMDAEAYPTTVRKRKKKYKHKLKTSFVWRSPRSARTPYVAQAGAGSPLDRLFHPCVEISAEKERSVIAEKVLTTLPPQGEQTPGSIADESNACLVSTSVHDNLVQSRALQICQERRNDGSALYSCSAEDCTFSFHDSCHAPAIRNYGSKWMCSYCVVKSCSAPLKTDRDLSLQKLTLVTSAEVTIQSYGTHVVARCDPLCAVLMDAYRKDYQKYYWDDPKNDLKEQYAEYVRLIKPNRPIWLGLIRQRIESDLQDEFADNVDVDAYLDMFLTIYNNCKRMRWETPDVTKYAIENDKAIKASIKKYLPSSNAYEQ